MVDRWKLYDLIWNKADKLLKAFNPCNIRVEEKEGYLFDWLVCNNIEMCKNKGEDLCCGGCRYKGYNGCITKCLECKIGWCWQRNSCEETFEDDLSHINISKIFIHKMDRLRKIMYRYKLQGCRISKKEVFEDEGLPLFYWQKTCI